MSLPSKTADNFHAFAAMFSCIPVHYNYHSLQKLLAKQQRIVDKRRQQNSIKAVKPRRWLNHWWPFVYTCVHTSLAFATTYFLFELLPDVLVALQLHDNSGPCYPGSYLKLNISSRLVHQMATAVFFSFARTCVMSLGVQLFGSQFMFAIEFDF